MHKTTGLMQERLSVWSPVAMNQPLDYPTWIIEVFSEMFLFKEPCMSVFHLNPVHINSKETTIICPLWCYHQSQVHCQGPEAWCPISNNLAVSRSSHLHKDLRCCSWNHLNRSLSRQISAQTTVELRVLGSSTLILYSWIYVVSPWIVVLTHNTLQ